MWLENYDRGVVVSMGAVLANLTIDGDVRQHYVVDVPGFVTDLDEFGNKVPVFWVEPEDVFQPYLLPSFSVRRGDPEVNYEGKSWYGPVGRKPAAGATAITDPVTGKSGYDRYENQWTPTPYRIPYEIFVAARLERESQLMLKHILRYFRQPYATILTYDSLGERRDYDAGPITVSRTSELADIADRIASHTVSFEVWAELDTELTYETQALTTVPTVDYNQIE